jgi:hypothetical protein
MSLYPYQQQAIATLLGGGGGKAVSASFAMDVPDELRTIEQEVQFARLVLGNSIQECRDPDVRWAPDAVQARLVEALRLAWEIEEVDNFRHDLDLVGHHQTLRDVFNKWQDRHRTTPRALAIRFEQHFHQMRDLARSLNKQLTRPPEDYSHEIMFAQEIIEAAFSAALTLEAHYEASAA